MPTRRVAEIKMPVALRAICDTGPGALTRKFDFGGWEACDAVCDEST
jgi:hypothetical protein